MPDSAPARKSPLVPAIVAILAAVALVASLSGTFSGSDETEEKSGGPYGTAVESGGAGSSNARRDTVARLQEGDPLAKGELDAPVVLIAYSDFQCPFCGRWSRETAPALDKYVDAGTLRIEWRDFPYLGPDSTTAARAGRAAAAQGAFWEFHDALFADQPAPSSGDLDQDFLEGVAEEIGLDLARFRADLKDRALAQQVEADFQEGQSLGVTGTPSFLINGVPVIGAQPTEAFEEYIEAAAR